MIPKALRPAVSNALDRSHTFAEIARIFDVTIAEIESFSAERNREREAKAEAILRASGDALRAEVETGLPAMAVRALQNRLVAERDEAERLAREAAAKAPEPELPPASE